MRVLTTIPKTSEWLSYWRNQNKIIGFVPTMGALHKGHLSLINKAKAENDLVITSIFVNPLQFNDKKDLEKYPRTLTSDTELLKTVGCDALFAPTVDEMYPSEKKEPDLNLELGILDKVLEGAHRPGHFKGVCIVVKKFFDIIQPNRVYFGEKDFQQLTIIKEMVRQLNMPVKIISVETMREPDGLAMSSRNILLTVEERKNASLIFQTLKKTLEKKSEPVNEIKNWVAQQINGNPYFKLDYFELADSHTLTPVHTLKTSASTRALIAVKVGAVRLIDNIPFT